MITRKTPVVEYLLGGLVSPMSSMVMENTRHGMRGHIDGGVFYDNQDVCERGLVVKPHHVNEPVYPVGEVPVYFEGRHLFGGMLSNEHFGHFIAENLSRLWALDQLDSSYVSIVYYLRVPKRPVAQFINETFRLLFPDVSLNIVTSLSQFELLAVPQDLLERSYTFGHPLIRSMSSRLRLKEEGRAKRVFVSRSGLAKSLGGLLGDRFIDERFAAEGYEIVHPEAISITEQLKVYASADYLVFADGSAVHLYALIANADQKVFIIWRRGKNPEFDLQIQSFGGGPVWGEPCLKELWVPEIDMPDTSRGKAILDFVQLSRQLKAAGFIDGPEWSQPMDEVMQAELLVVSAEKDRKYVLKPLKGSAGASN